MNSHFQTQLGHFTTTHNMQVPTLKKEVISMVKDLHSLSKNEFSSLQ